MDMNYDIVMREDDFMLYSNEQPVITALGNEITHNNARMLRHAINHEMFPSDKAISPLKLLRMLSDIRASSVEIFNFDLEERLTNDPLLVKSQMDSSLLNEILQNSSELIDFIFLNSSSLASSLNNFLLKKDNKQSITDYISQFINALSVEQKVVFNTLIQENGVGLLIHLLLLNGSLSVMEYSAGILICKLKSNHPETIHLWEKERETGLVTIQKKVYDNAIVAIDFLTLCKSENKSSVIEEIIKRGEDNQTEFKSTLRWDIRQAKKNPAIEHAALKTICAFLNSEGGDLLIGVRDDGSIEGVETDQFNNDDRFLLHIWTLIKTCMGQEVVEWVKTSLQKFGDKTVCRVNCQQATKPVFLKQSGFDEAFYVRVGPSSSSLDISSALKYIEQHF